MGGDDHVTLKFSSNRRSSKTIERCDSPPRPTSQASNGGNLPDDVIKLLTSDEFEAREESNGSTTTDISPFRKNQAQPCAPALHVRNRLSKEQLEKRSNCSETPGDGCSAPQTSFGRQGEASRNGISHPGAYNCTVQGDDSIDEGLITDDSVGELGANMSAITDLNVGMMAPLESATQRITDTYVTTAHLVESDDEEAPWKKEVDRLKRELETLKQNQSQIVMAESVSAGAIEPAPQNAEVSHADQANSNVPKEEPNLRFTTSIYGREKESAQLKQSLQDASGSSKQLVLISGESGVGKSVLAQSLKREDCHFLAGKYDSQKREQPYSAIGDACDHLCQEVLLHHKNGPESPYPYQQFRAKVRTLLDESDTDILQTIIPSLTRMVGESASTPDISYMEVKYRFQHAFKIFMKLLCSFGTPLVLALDDLQWVDQPSLDLLTSLLTDTDAPAFMLIACYRDDEVEKNHAFAKAVEKWKAAAGQLDVMDIPVKNLSEAEVCFLLQDLLSSSQEDTLALAKCVHTKTLGNPFYMKQFVLSVLGAGMLSFSEEHQRWQYDVYTLNDAATATDNVVALLTNKLQKLPHAVQTILPRVACLGTRFHRNTAQIVMDCDAVSQGEGDMDTLVSCVKEGLIVDCGQGWFKWEHDKVLEAALLLIEIRKLDALKSDLGWLLLDKLPQEEVSSHLFAITNLLNAGTKSGQNQRISELVGLNLRSGKTAFESSAFESACQFLKHGISLLPDDHWESQLELSLEMYSTAAEAHYCFGEFQQCLEYCDGVLGLTSCDLLKKRRVYNVRIHALGNQGQVSEAMDLVKHLLKRLGCKFPRLGRGVSAIAGVMRTAMSVEKTTSKLDCLLPVEDEAKKWAIYLTNRLAHWSYLVEPSLTPLAIVKGLDWTVKYGRTDVTSPILGTIALILAGSVGDFSGGKKYGELAIKYMESSVASKALFLCYQFVFHYHLPTKSCLPHLQESYEIGMKTGDVESAFWASYCVLEARLHTGSPLAELAEDCALFSRRTASHNQEMIGWSVQPCKQLVANLMNKDSNKHVLTGDFMDEERFKEKIAEHSHYHHQLSRYKIAAAFLFNEHEIVVETMEEYGYHNFSIEKATPGTNGIATLYFQCAMSCVSLVHKDKKKHAVQNKRAKKFLAKLKDWGNKGNPNVQHYGSLLEAELASLSGKPSIVAAKHYDYAILLADQQDLINDHGLAHERFGDHCRRNGDEEGAKRQYEMAIQSYKKWGALAKTAIVECAMIQESVDFVNTQ